MSIDSIKPGAVGGGQALGLGPADVDAPQVSQEAADEGGSGFVAAETNVPAITSNARKSRIESTPRYTLDRTLADYDLFTKLSQLDTIAGAIQRRLDAGICPVRVLEFGAGHGNAARRLKDAFGDKVEIDNQSFANEVAPENRSAFKSHIIAFTEDLRTLPHDYDLIIGIYGGPFYSEDIRNSVGLITSHLVLGGEAFVLFSKDVFPDEMMMEYGGIFLAASRALGMEVEHKKILNMNYPLYPPRMLYIRRLGARADLFEVARSAIEIQWQVLREVQNITEEDWRGLKSLSFEQRGLIVDMAAQRVGGRLNLPLRFGYRENAGGEILTGWEQLVGDVKRSAISAVGGAKLAANDRNVVFYSESAIEQIFKGALVSEAIWEMRRYLSQTAKF